MVPGVAAFGLLALWARHAARPRPSLALRAATAVGVLVHVVVASLLLPVRSDAIPSMLARMVDRGAASMAPVNAGPAEELIVLSATDSLMPTSMVMQRRLLLDPAHARRAYHERRTGRAEQGPLADRLDTEPGPRGLAIGRDPRVRSILDPFSPRSGEHVLSGLRRVGGTH